MKPVAAIVQSAHDELVARVRETFQKYRVAREQLGKRRFALGQALMRIRSAWPERGPKAKGWGDFLAKEGIDQDVALDAMKYAGYVETHFPDAPGNLPTMREAGLDSRPRASDAPTEQPAEPEVEIDRDTWCTPKWITDAIGRWQLDPCANERSHVDAERCFMLEACGEDGLVLARDVKKTTRVFINPPYSDVMPWIDAYGHTRFCFLLKLDTSTKWFEALLAKCELVLMPRRTRVRFEPPPGIPPESAIANQFPHALFYARAADATDAIKALCFPGWFINRG